MHFLPSTLDCCFHLLCLCSFTPAACALGQGADGSKPMEQQLKQDLPQIEGSFSSDHYGRVENIRRDFKQFSHHKPIRTMNSQDRRMFFIGFGTIQILLIPCQERIWWSEQTLFEVQKMELALKQEQKLNRFDHV